MICPKCKEELHIDNKTYKCINNHSYDISKEGYVNLLLSHPNAGDNKDLVNARVNFLNNNYYDFLGLFIKEYLNSCLPIKSKILDCGCGTGYYDLFINDYNLFGIDISKYAISYASKHNKNNKYIVASNANIPFSNNEFDCLLFIFSPIFIDESIRVLKNNGFIINVTPGIKHLYELKKNFIKTHMIILIQLLIFLIFLKVQKNY